MKKHIIKKALLPTLACGSLLAAASAQAQATVITDWTFENIAATTVTASPAPFTGIGTATSLGMDNTYGTPGPSMTADDVIASTGSSTGAGNEWRVRGAKIGTGQAANGWSSAAPIGSQGAQFSVSTVGFSNIRLTFDLETTANSENNVAVFYTTDGSTWIDATISSVTGTGAAIRNNTTSANTVLGSYLSLGTLFNDNITVDFSTVTAANNDANFAVRIVNASTGADVVDGSGAAYNNKSGNWRYDNVEIASTPEPTALTLGGLALVGAFAARRKFTSK